MKPLLVCVDFSDVTPRVMDEARDLARTLTAGVHVIHVVPTPPDYMMYSPGASMPMAAVAPDMRVETERLQTLIAPLADASVKAWYEVLEGQVIDEIIATANRIGAGHIVMGSHGHSAFYNLVLGSVTEAILRKVDVPLVIVPSPKPATKRRKS